MAQTTPYLRLKTKFTSNHFAVFTNTQFLLIKSDNFINIAKINWKLNRNNITINGLLKRKQKTDKKLSWWFSLPALVNVFQSFRAGVFCIVFAPLPPLEKNSKTIYKSSIAFLEKLFYSPIHLIQGTPSFLYSTWTLNVLTWSLGLIFFFLSRYTPFKYCKILIVPKPIFTICSRAFLSVFKEQIL